MKVLALASKAATASAPGGGLEPAAVLHGWNVAALITAAFSLAGALIVLLVRERAPEAVFG